MGRSREGDENGVGGWVETVEVALDCLSFGGFAHGNWVFLLGKIAGLLADVEGRGEGVVLDYSVVSVEVDF